MVLSRSMTGNLRTCFSNMRWAARPEVLIGEAESHTLDRDVRTIAVFGSREASSYLAYRTFCAALSLTYLPISSAAG